MKGSDLSQFISDTAAPTLPATAKNPMTPIKTATCMKCLCAFGNLAAPKVNNIKIIPNIPGMKAVQL